MLVSKTIESGQKLPLGQISVSAEDDQNTRGDTPFKTKGVLKRVGRLRHNLNDTTTSTESQCIVFNVWYFRREMETILAVVTDLFFAVKVADRKSVV